MISPPNQNYETHPATTIEVMAREMSQDCNQQDLSQSLLLGQRQHARISRRGRQEEDRILAIHREFEILADDPAGRHRGSLPARPCLVVPGGGRRRIAVANICKNSVDVAAMRPQPIGPSGPCTRHPRPLQTIADARAGKRRTKSRPNDRASHRGCPLLVMPRQRVRATRGPMTGCGGASRETSKSLCLLDRPPSRAMTSKVPRFYYKRLRSNSA